MKEVWTEQYRPSELKDIILPERIKSTFKDIVASGNMPNLMLSGSAGTGKTTAAIALCEELDVDYIKINASNERNIDTLRTVIQDFASTMSMRGRPFRVVILDEADNLNANSTQPALRGFIEEFASNCRFIFTCNNKSKIIAPLHSRCSVIDFKFSEEELKVMAGQFFDRLVMILKENGVEVEMKVLAQLIKTYCRHGSPDWRRILNECQRYSVSGTIDKGIFDDLSKENIDGLVKNIKNRKYDDMARWVIKNTNLSPVDIHGSVYDSLLAHGVDKASLPVAGMIIADYNFKSAFVDDQVVNTRACMAELMMRLEWIN